jgi:hypothetical protein
LENNGFVKLKVAQFFLIPGENGGRPWLAPEDKHNPPASDLSLTVLKAKLKLRKMTFHYIR